MKRSISYTEALTDVSFNVASRTICHVNPAVGRQKVPFVALGFVEGGGRGPVEDEDEDEELSLPPWLSPTPNPTPRAMAMRSIVETDRIQNHFPRRAKHD